MCVAAANAWGVLTAIRWLDAEAEANPGAGCPELVVVQLGIKPACITLASLIHGGQNVCGVMSAL